MARPATGNVIEPKGQRRSWGLRFMAYGVRRHVRLGLPGEGWDRGRAETELRHVLADVERGIWRPHEPEPAEVPTEIPSFHAFASEWLANREPELRPKTIESYRWQLSHHLLPFFKDYALPQITAESVDAYKAAALRRGALAPTQINKTLGLFGLILKAARRYGHMEHNPLADVDRLKASKPARPTMEPEQLPALLDAANRQFRPFVAVLAGAGLRNGEACALNWRDVNIATGTLRVGKAKTDAGVRQVDLPDALRSELAIHKADSSMSPSDPVFVNGGGRRQTVSNAERRLKTAVRHANERLTKLSLEPISEAVTPHSLRRLYASLRYAAGDSPVYVAEMMGHADGGGLSMSTYAKAVRRRERLTGVALREFDRACVWAHIGANEPESVAGEALSTVVDNEEMASQSRNLYVGPDSSVG